MPTKGYALIQSETDRIAPAEVAQTPMGEIYMIGNVTETTITTQDVYTRMEGTTSLGHAVLFDSPATNQLRYIGAETRNFHIGVTLVLASTGTNQVVGAVVYKNGVVDENGEYTAGTELSNGKIRLNLPTANVVASTAIHVMMELATNDIIELAVKNESGTTDILISEVNLFAMGTPDSI